MGFLSISLFVKYIYGLYSIKLTKMTMTMDIYIMMVAMTRDLRFDKLAGVGITEV